MRLNSVTPRAQMAADDGPDGAGEAGGDDGVVPDPTTYAHADGSA